MRAKTQKFVKSLCPEGLHVVRLVNIVDWGTQKDSFGSRAKVELNMETPEQLHVFNEDKGEQPYVLSRKFGNTLGSAKKPTDLKKFIEAFVGHPIDEEFDISQAVGKLAQLNVTHEQDGEYTNEKLSTPLPLSKQQLQFAEQGGYPEFNDQYVLDLDAFDEEVWGLLPKWKQEQIAKTPEYAAAISGESVQDGPGEEVSEEEAMQYDEAPADELPFEEPAPVPAPVKKVTPAPAVKKMVPGQGFSKPAASPAPVKKAAPAPVKKTTPPAKSPVKKAAPAPVKKTAPRKFK